jgi:hypothetical protein
MIPGRRALAPLALAIVFAAPLLATMGGPFLRHREGIGATFGVLSRNYLRIGYAETRLGLYEVSAPDLSVYGDWRKYCYPNRPVVSVLVTSFWFLALGDAEWVLRLSLLAAALGTLAGFWALACRLLGDRWGLVALAAFAFNPMFWYFSGVAVHLAYSLCFSMVAWACWVRRSDHPRWRILAFAFVVLACGSDWPGYFAALSIAIDAWLDRRRIESGALLGTALACFGLHLLHLTWIDAEGGSLVRRFLSAGAERSALGLPSFLGFAASEARELGIYFTAGGLLLAAVGLRRFPRRVWLLALLGLEELVFMHWAFAHDFLTYSLTPFFALAAAKGVETLWTSVPRRALAGSLLALAVAQSLWVTGDRLTRRGAYEVQYRAGLAIREGTRPSDRVLLTIADLRQYTPYYADRYTAGIEGGDPPRLMVHPSGGGVPVRGGVDELADHLDGFDVVLVGDPEMAALGGILFFGGKPPPESFGFLRFDHPLRRKIEQRAISREARGPFVLYRLR